MKRIVSILLIISLLCSLNGATAYAFQNVNTLPELTGNHAQDVANIAESQIGYEYSDGSYFGDWWNTVTDWGVDYTELDWCAMFACWCANQAGAGLGITYNRNSAIVQNLWDYTLNNGICDTSFTLCPQPGDFVFYGKNIDTLSHVAVITAYNPVTNVVTIVGGNEGGAVKEYSYVWEEGIYHLNLELLGLGRPSYNRYHRTNPITFHLQGGMEKSYATSMTVTGFNVSRGSNNMIIYTQAGETSGANSYGIEIAVNADGKVIQKREYGDTTQLIVPEGGFVLSGHGKGYNFINKIHIGDYVGYLSNGETTIYTYNNESDYLYYHKNVDKNQAYGSLPIVVQNEYLFNGCFTEQTAGEEIMWDTLFYSNNLYAHWVKTEDACPSASIVNKEDGHSYQRFDYIMSWENAKTFCESIGGSLVCIDSENEQNFLISSGILDNTRRNKYAIGSLFSDDQLKWLDVTNSDVHYADSNTGFICEFEGCNHSYDEEIIIKEANCTEEGIKKQNCQECNYINIETISALGHEWEETYTIDESASMSSSGSKSYHCSVCGEKNLDRVLEIPTLDSVTLSETVYTYNGKSKKPAVTVKDSNGDVIEASNYSISYADGRVNVGKYKVLVTFKNEYTGSVALYFTVKPKSAKISKLTTGPCSFTLSWNEVEEQVDGYQIRYAGNDSFKNCKTITISGNLNISKTVEDLNAGQKYYVKVRAYKNSDNVRYYSDWSGVKTVTPKPMPTSINQISSGGRSFTVEWKKVTSQVTGYQIRYATNSSFENYKTITVNGNNKISYTINKLNAGVKYYVKVRSYRMVNEKQYYSEWSTIKTITPKPMSTSIKKISSGGRSFTVNWTKATSQVSGYQIRYATNSSFENYKTVTVKGINNASKTIKKLNAGSKYYVKIRTYRTMNGKNYYSSWSTVKRITSKPMSTTISSISSGSKKITVKWKEITSQVSGYQIQYSTSHSFDKYKSVKVARGKTTKTLYNLISGKTYYVRIRTYRTLNGTTYYSSWSTQKFVKTK